MAEARAEAAGEAVELQGSEVEVRSELISEVYTQLLLLLPHAVDVARDYQAGTGIERVRAASDKLSSDDVGRLAPFYRVCAWCARHADVPPPTEPPPGQRAFDPFNFLYQAYVAQDTLHVECDETKKAMLELWYRAAKRGGAGSPPLTVFVRGGDDRNWVLTRLIESFISLKPNNEKFVAYNRYTLPHFYGLVELAVAADEPLAVLRGSKNFWFAIKQFLVDSSTYTFEPYVEAPRVAGPAAPPAAAAPAAAPMGPAPPPAFTASFEPYGDPPAAGPAPAPAPAPAAVRAPAPAPAQAAPAVGSRETVLAKILFGLVKRCAELEPGGDEFRQKLLIAALTSKKCFGKEVHPQQAVALLRICIADDADRGVAVDHDVLATLSDCLQSERLAAAAAAAPTAERASALVELPLRLLHECVVYMRTQLAADDDRRTRALAAWEGTVASSMFGQILLGLPAAGAAPLPAQLRDAGIDVAIEVAAVDATIAKQILFVLNAAHRGSSDEERMAIENNPAARAPSYHARWPSSSRPQCSRTRTPTRRASWWRRRSSRRSRSPSTPSTTARRTRRSPRSSRGSPRRSPPPSPPRRGCARCSPSAVPSRRSRACCRRPLRSRQERARAGGWVREPYSDVDSMRRVVKS